MRKTHTTFLFFVSLYAFVLLPLRPISAQSLDLSENPDIFAPLIRHQPAEETLASGAPHKIEARVTDNLGIDEVILYYRTHGNEPYSSINMESIWQDNYSAIIPKEDITEPELEYYIQARDKSGNTSQRAFPFSPLRVEVVAAPIAEVNELEKQVVIAPISPPAPEQETVLNDEISPRKREAFALSTKKPGEMQTLAKEKPWYKKWWVWAIVVTVAGGVAAASSGGGSDAGAPTTGAIDVSGPVL